MIRVEEDEEYNEREKKRINNKEGWFVEKYDVIDKYTRRDKRSQASDALTPSQFWKMYEACHTVKRTKSKNLDITEEDVDEGSEDENNLQRFSGIEKFHYVMTATKGKPMALPEYIALENPFPGEPPFMRKRKGPAVLRFHKPKQSVDPGAYFFAEALLYTSFRTEQELEDRVNEAAKDGYAELEKEINAVKLQVMEFLESNEEARYLVDEASHKIKEMGEILDAEGEHDNLDCEQEVAQLHPDYEHLNPDEIKLAEKGPRHEKSWMTSLKPKLVN